MTRPTWPTIDTPAYFWPSQTEAVILDLQAEADVFVTHTQQSNPHGTTASDIGLGNVPNVDATLRSNHTGSQPISSVTNLQSTLDSKVNTSRTVSGKALTTDITLLPTDVGLGNVPNVDATNRANHTGSQAIASVTNLQSTLDSKVPASRTVNGQPLSYDISLTKSDIGLSNLTNDKQLTEASKETNPGLTSNSDNNVPSSKAVRSYVQANAITASSMFQPMLLYDGNWYDNIGTYWKQDTVGGMAFIPGNISLFPVYLPAGIDITGYAVYRTNDNAGSYTDTLSLCIYEYVPFSSSLNMVTSQRDISVSTSEGWYYKDGFADSIDETSVYFIGLHSTTNAISYRTYMYGANTGPFGFSDYDSGDAIILYQADGKFSGGSFPDPVSMTNFWPVSSHAIPYVRFKVNKQ